MVKVLNATELCTLKRLILCYVYFTQLEKRNDSLALCNTVTLCLP